WILRVAMLPGRATGGGVVQVRTSFASRLVPIRISASVMSLEPGKVNASTGCPCVSGGAKVFHASLTRWLDWKSRRTVQPCGTSMRKRHAALTKAFSWSGITGADVPVTGVDPAEWGD